MLPILLLFICACPSLARGAETERPLHLAILSGQSNMEGMREHQGFLPELHALLPDHEIRSCKVAKGGRPIRLWLHQDWPALAARQGLDPTVGDEDLHAEILAAIAGLLGDGARPASISFCWMQGERDAKEGVASAYGEALAALVAALRRDLQRPDLVVVVGRISDYQSGEPAWEAVRTAQVAWAASDSQAAWVDSDDCNDLPDGRGGVVQDLHYSAEGYELFGRRLARQIARLLAGQEPAADGRP